MKTKKKERKGKVKAGKESVKVNVPKEMDKQKKRRYI